MSGGPEKYLFSIKEILEDKGIEVFPFSVKSGRNIITEWEEYFLSPISSDDSVYFHEYKKDFKTIIKVIERSFYSPEGFFRARKYAERVSPDIIYSLHFLNKMSPSILDGFKSLGIPVIVRLSDFGLICPQGLLFYEGRNCEACIKGGLLNCIKNRCVQESLSGSLIKFLAWKMHRIIGSISRIDAFVCPSSFTKTKYIEAGFPESKLYHIPSFIDMSALTPDYTGGSYVLYFGRLVYEKGVHVLLEAYNLVGIEKPKLVIIGSTDKSEYCQSLKEKSYNNVEFIDFIEIKELYQFIQNACFVVVPSTCYDNMPNVVLEAFAHGKPVIASRNGGFPDLIEESRTGLLFETGNAESLAKKLTWAIKHPAEMIEMGMKAREHAENNFSPDVHFKRLNSLFNRFM